jgi:hypothetical protein
MQGKWIIAIAVAAFGSTTALAGDSIRRSPCPKAEQPQQRQQQNQQQQQPQRTKPQGCPVTRNVPPVVDPTPVFLL